MRELFASLAQAVLLGSTLLSAKTAQKSCSAGCCNSRSDCPHPACCVKKEPKAIRGMGALPDWLESL